MATFQPTDLDATYTNGFKIGLTATTADQQNLFNILDLMIDTVDPSDPTKFQLKMNSKAKLGFDRALRVLFPNNINLLQPIKTYRGIAIVMDNTIANNLVYGGSSNTTNIYLVSTDNSVASSVITGLQMI